MIALLRFIVVSFISFLTFYFLNRPLTVKGTTIPPLGKFLSPFQGFWQNAEPLRPKLPEEMTIKGIQGEATVLYDSLLIPHIFAENDKDLYFLQGYVTAQHRLWQMEFQTHAAAGRISELVGEKALDFDREMRRKGMVFAATNFLKAIEQDPVLSQIVLSYTQGVNAYIDQLSYKDFPLEYKLLDYAPERWTMLKCALLLKYMANNLSGWDADLEDTNALKKFGRALFDKLYPDTQPYQEPVVRETTWNFTPISIDTSKISRLVSAVEINNPEKPSPYNGSNNWAVAPQKTANGNPILCNDPHLGLNLPSIWFLMQLSTPTHRVKGATLPGAPCVIVGFNENIAWGVTNARRDVVDWYKVHFKDTSRDEYLLDDGWKKTEKVVEKFQLKNGMFFYDTIVYTVWGPVVYDDTFKSNESPRKGYALRWIAHDSSKELLTFYLLNRAKNYQEYRQAISYYDCPAQNFVFASNQGDIAITVQGKFPVKWKEQGKFALDGTNSQNRWQAFIPFEHNPHELNPARGFVSSANQHPVDETYPYYVYDGHYEYFRNRRIHQLLNRMNSIRVEDMMLMQNDNYDLQATEALPFLLAYLSDSSTFDTTTVTTAFYKNATYSTSVQELIQKAKKTPIQGYVYPRVTKIGHPTISLSAEEQHAYLSLKSWNYIADANQVAPSYFNTWYDLFYEETWDEITTSKERMRKPEKATTFRLMAEHPSFEFFDKISTPEKETAKELARLTFRMAVAKVEAWKKETGKDAQWADYRNMRATHLARIPAFSTDVLQVGGNRHVVNANAPGGHGASWRMIVELDPKGTKAWGVYPGGQSGNVGSPYFLNMVAAWEKGQYFPLNLWLSSEKEVFIKQTFKAP